MSKQVTIQIASDLHEDINKKGPIDVWGDHLILAGDISDNIDHWEGYACIGKPVIAVLGNHEFVQKIGSVEERVLEFKEKYKDTDIHFLYNEILYLDGVNYIGSTMWSDITMVENSISNNRDCKWASGLYMDEWMEEYEKAFTFLESSLSTLENPIVVTHFSPSFLSETAYYKDSDFSNFFHTDLNDFIKLHKPFMWIHGHVHSQHDYYIGTTRIVTNPRGNTKNSENPSFKKRFTITIA